MNFIIRYLKRLGYVLFIFLICLFGLEICFRYQVIDFYKAELKGLNSKEQLASTKNNILVFGDSFTAHPNGYVSYLRKSFPNYNFINSAIPGTGIKQHELFFKSRIKKYNPKVIIYQFYIGNDFIDIKHPINYRELSLVRNLFWELSENFLILKYINHRLAFFNRTKQPLNKIQKENFSIKVYNHRVKINYKAANYALNNTVLLKSKKIKETYKIWKNKLAILKNITGDSIPITLLIIPDNAQINKASLNKNIELGANLSSRILNSEYPLIKQIKQDFKKWNIINPLPKFQQLENNDKLYYQNDPHLTIYGQKELSKIVIDKLTLPIE